MKKPSLLSALLLFPVVSVAATLQPIGDDALAEVTGQEGIIMGMTMNLNLDANANTLTSLANCKNTNLCNIALQFHNRNDNGGEWLVLKDVTISIKINDLYVDAAFTPVTPSPYADSSRFLSRTGGCLTDPTLTAAGCAAGVLDNPTVQFSFNGAYGTFERDIEIYQRIGRMAVEYGATGYANDNNGTFMGLLISDTTRQHASIDIDGKVFLSGF